MNHEPEAGRMQMSRRILCLVTWVLLLAPVRVMADNTTAANAQNVVPGQLPVVVTTDDTNSFRWYVFTAVAGRSYCVETAAENAPGTSEPLDTVITVYGADAMSGIWFNDNTPTEPRSGENAGSGLSRACYRAGVSEHNFIRVEDSNSGSQTYWMRVVETTLWGPWFFVGGDYNAFTTLRNTGNTDVGVYVTWRDAAGTVLDTTFAAIPPNGAIAPNAKSFCGAGCVNGTVEVAHYGSPEQIVGNTTSLSATSGLSFDTPLQQRRAW